MDRADYRRVDSKPIVVRVGTTKQEFYVHEELLRASSKFFDTALKKEWKEGQEAAVDLRDVEPDQFRAWVKFLYTGRIFVEQKDGESEVEECIEGRLWAELYALQDFLGDGDFGDALIDAIIERMITLRKWPVMFPNFVYLHSETASSHRLLAVDSYVNIWNRSTFENLGGHPAQFLGDILKAIGPRLHKGIKGVDIKVWFDKVDNCKYHNHGDKPCYKTKPAFRF
jgi:hypothetical protein